MARASAITSLVSNTSLLLPANQERSQSELTHASESGSHDSHRKSTKQYLLVKLSCTATLKGTSKIWPHSVIHSADELFLSFLPVILPLQKPSGFLSFSLNLGNWTKPKEEKMTSLVPQQHSDKGSNWQQSPWDCPALIKPSHSWWS